VGRRPDSKTEFEAMKFYLAPTEPNYDLFKLVSENGAWELGLWKVLFGARVRFGQAGACGVELDYCAGADPHFQIELLNAVHIILQEVPETVTPGQIQRMFPDFYMKPINRDPICWPRLQQMRDDVRQRLRIADEYLAPGVKLAA
jgi:hypothetical protein